MARMGEDNTFNSRYFIFNFKTMKLTNNLTLFVTGFMQVFFVAMNTYFIATKNVYGTGIAGFIISLIWSFNVKKIAFGGVFDRVVYAIGAAVGSLIGLLVSMNCF